PVSAVRAAELGLIDAVGPRNTGEFDAWLAKRVAELAGPAELAAATEAAGRRAPDRPLSYHRTIELAEMARDIFDDRHGFAARRRDFLRKSAAPETPERLRFALAGGAREEVR